MLSLVILFSLTHFTFTLRYLLARERLLFLVERTGGDVGADNLKEQLVVAGVT